ncbi:MAG TPA: YkgJ family cysteine cluster protein [bacterium]|nr:YkgJ family cysteine cluster protein [bacterium]
MKLETDLARILELAKEKEAENQAFRVHIRRCSITPEEIDGIVHRLSGIVSSKIDCRTCANCCRELYPALSRRDIARLAQAVGVTPDVLAHTYLKEVEEKGKFVPTQKPCPFLQDKLCRYYHSRPESCVDFPFLYRPDFATHSVMALWNLPYCPIVYNVYELLKAEIAELEMLRRSAKEEDLE